MCYKKSDLVMQIIFIYITLLAMADAFASFDISFGDIMYVIVVLGSKSLFKGTLNTLHLRKRHQCAVC